jgi:hypothetical protein
MLGSAGILALSLILVGPQSLSQLSLLIMGYAHGLPSNSPEVMVNWRALGTNLSFVMPGLIPWIIIFAGMILTVFIVLSLWRLTVSTRSPQYAVLLLGTFAGTFAVTWHAHIPMLTAILPLILFLYARKLLPLKILAVWFFLPPIYFGITYLIAPANARVLFGLSYLAVNLVFVGWAARVLGLFSKTSSSV